MTECGNVTSSVRALGIDIGSTHTKAAVVALDGRMHELAVAQRPVAGLGGAALVAAALDAAREVLDATQCTIAVVGIASMAETGALVGSDGIPGPLLRWDRAGDPAERLGLARHLDAALLHARTGAPLVPKLPLLTWAALVARGIPRGSRWAFAADLVAAALTGRIATDHTLAGRSGAFPLPEAGAPLGSHWDEELLESMGVPSSLLPEVLLPGESAGAVRSGRLAGAAVHIVGHDHAVAAWTAGADRPGRVAHSLGTTEAVIALADRPVDRARAGREGMSVVRAVDGVHEAVLAGSPSAGALVAHWSERTGAASLLGSPRVGGGRALALPYSRGRQSPSPDPGASYLVLDDDPADPAAELTGILRGLAAHGAWMRSVVAELTASGTSPAVSAVGTPARLNPRLAALMAFLAGAPLPVVDLEAPVASGAAAIAAARAGLAGPCTAPFRLVEPADDGMPDLAERFANAIAATAALTEGAL